MLNVAQYTTPTPVPAGEKFNINSPSIRERSGLTQEDQRPVIAHTSTRQATSQASTSPTAAQALSPVSQMLLVLGGLLAAAAIMLWGLRIRRSATIQSIGLEVKRSSGPITPLPALFVNEYSPLLTDRSTGQLAFPNQYSPVLARQETEQLAFPNQYSPVLARSETEQLLFSQQHSRYTSEHGIEQLPFPEWTAPFVPQEQRTEALAPAQVAPISQFAPIRGGLLKRYRFTEISSQQSAIMPTGIEVQQEERVLVGLSASVREPAGSLRERMSYISNSGLSGAQQETTSFSNPASVKPRTEGLLQRYKATRGE